MGALQGHGAEGEKRLANRNTAGMARMVLGSSEALPFGDGEFSAVAAGGNLR